MTRLAEALAGIAMVAFLVPAVPASAYTIEGVSQHQVDLRPGGKPGPPRHAGPPRKSNAPKHAGPPRHAGPPKNPGNSNKNKKVRPPGNAVGRQRPSPSNNGGPRIIYREKIVKVPGPIRYRSRVERVPYPVYVDRVVASPAIPQEKTVVDTVIRAVGIGTLTLLALLALCLLVLWLGYVLGYRDSDKQNTKFMSVLSDSLMIRRNK